MKRPDAEIIGRLVLVVAVYVPLTASQVLFGWPGMAAVIAFWLGVWAGLAAALLSTRDAS